LHVETNSLNDYNFVAIVKNIIIKKYVILITK